MSRGVKVEWPIPRGIHANGKKFIHIRYEGWRYKLGLFGGIAFPHRDFDRKIDNLIGVDVTSYQTARLNS
jgi:hypothetical protein